jgi:c-di-GMP-binding flagellar brake protein YcgR
MTELTAASNEETEDRSWWWKCCQQLKVADRVQLVVSGADGSAQSFPGALNDNAEHEAPRYSAWVDDIQEDRIVLGIRLEDALALKLKAGQKIVFKRAHEDGIWTYEGVVSADRAIKLEIPRPLKASRIQRREFCRVPMERETRFAGADEPVAQRQGLALSISGGGLSMAVNDETAVGEHLKIDVPLDNEIVSMEGVVRRVAAQKERGYEYLLGIEFVDPLMIDQDKVIGFVFTRQLKLRKERIE